MAGPGSDRCGVGVGHSFAELREVAFEECPTGIGELGVKRAYTFFFSADCKQVYWIWLGHAHGLGGGGRANKVLKNAEKVF